MPQSTDEKLMATMEVFHRTIKQKIRSYEKEGEISHFQFEVLDYIHANPNATMREVAEYFGVSPPSITTTIQQLVNNGYLVRTFDEKDRRIIRLKLTKEGKKIWESANNALQSRMAQMIYTLTEEEKQTFITIIKKLAK